MRGFIVVLVICCFPFLVYGQSTQYGLSGGLNASTLKLYKPEVETEIGSYRPGINLGLSVEKFSDKTIGVLSGVYFSFNQTKGLDHKVKASVVNIPGMLKINEPLPLNLDFSYHILAGGAASYVIYAKNFFHEIRGDRSFYIGYNVTPDLTRRYELSLTGGIGFDFGSFTMNGRYMQGMTNYYESSNLNYGYIKSRKFILQFIYPLDFKR